MKSVPVQDDRILLQTRLVLIVVVPSLLLATLLHWDRFDITQFPFQLCLILYIITPFLVPYLWIKNRATDPGTPEADDVSVTDRNPPGAKGLRYGSRLGLSPQR